MNWIVSDYHNIMLILCGAFYSVLCIFSLVTGLMYALGKRKLNPVELSDKLVKKLDTEEKVSGFARKMGWVTFAVGILQGVTAFAIFKGYHPAFYGIAIGFTAFSFLSAESKLISKFNWFSLIKIIFYIAIFVILLLSKSRELFFA